MTRNIFLVVYPEARSNVPAHWSIFIPNTDGDTVGKVIQAIGNPFQGYTVEVKSGYNLALTQKRYEKIPLGTVEDANLSAIESKSRDVAAPGISPKPMDPFAGENCQTWLQNYVATLVQLGLLASTAQNVLASAPKV